MIWIRIVVICVLMCLLQAHKDCTGHVQWENLTSSLNSMGTAISLDCAFDYEDGSLCNPLHLINMVNHNTNLLAGVIMGAEKLYKKNPNPLKFIMALRHTRDSISKCIHHSTSHVENEHVTSCFNQLQEFLHKKSHSHCAWQIINSKVKEILQRLEKRSVRGRDTKLYHVFGHAT